MTHTAPLVLKQCASIVRSMMVVPKSLAAGLSLVAASSTTCAVAADFPYAKRHVLTVHRNGQIIGMHTLLFGGGAAHRTVSVTTNLEIKMQGVVTYRYSHSSDEVWNGAALQSLTAKTDDNGRLFTVRAHLNGAGLAVERVAPSSASLASNFDRGLVAPTVSQENMPVDILPTSNWNIAQVKKSVLLNTQYGVRAQVKTTEIGREAITTASGKTIQATRYQYMGDLRLDQWFDDVGRWVKTSFKAFDGSTVELLFQD